MIDYTIYYKETLPVEGDWPGDNQWDTFISAYTSATRVRRVFEKVNAAHKYWLLFSEYGFSRKDYPPGPIFDSDTHDEVEFITAFWNGLKHTPNLGTICIDTTGFIRPYLCFLVRWFMSQGIRRFDAIYAEPAHYAKREETTFSGGTVVEVRQVKGFEGIHETNAVDSKSKDVLIVNVGYDDRLIVQVAEAKESSRKIARFGFPSLRADMYQENVLCGTPGQGISRRVGTFFCPCKRSVCNRKRIEPNCKRLESAFADFQSLLVPVGYKGTDLGICFVLRQ